MLERVCSFSSLLSLLPSLFLSCVRSHTRLIVRTGRDSNNDKLGYLPRTASTTLRITSRAPPFQLYELARARSSGSPIRCISYLAAAARAKREGGCVAGARGNVGSLAAAARRASELLQFINLRRHYRNQLLFAAAPTDGIYVFS